MTRNHRNFRKSALSERVAQFGRPCRGLTLAGFASNCSESTLMIYMTRRAFLSLRVLIICNSAAKEIGSEKRPLFLKLSNWLFNLIAARSRFSYKTQLFFNNSENHRKSSLRTRLEKTLKNISKTPENWKSLVFFKTLENSKTSVKTNRILTFLLLVKIHLEKSNFIFVARLRWEGCAA